jgi:hypothetical protein
VGDRHGLRQVAADADPPRRAAATTSVMAAIAIGLMSSQSLGDPDTTRISVTGPRSSLRLFFRPDAVFDAVRQNNGGGNVPFNQIQLGGCRRLSGAWVVPGVRRSPLQ